MSAQTVDLPEPPDGQFAAEEALDHLHEADPAPARNLRADLSLSEAAVAILTRSVHLTTGNLSLSPRPGQNMMIRDIVAAMCAVDGDGQAAVVAGTGTGKSFVYLATAAASWATTGKRSVISTESLALQAQITDKDAPVVAEACETITGMRPKVSVLKGWSNFVCTANAVETANQILDAHGKTGSTDPKVLARKFSKIAEGITDSNGDPEAEKEALVAWALDQITDSNGDPEAEKEALVAWALDQINDHGKPGVSGDKNTYPGNLSDTRTWESVSVASGDCLGADRCPFAEQCFPRLAREQAAESDIVVTNHTLLGVQAANDIPVVIGSKTLGVFDNLFIDEAHGLPSTVRGQGSVEISGRAVRTLARSLGRTLDDRDPSVNSLLATAEPVADYVADDLDALARTGRGRGAVVRLAASQSPLENADTVLEKWLKRAAELVKAARKNTTSHSAEIALRRAENRVQNMLDALDLVCEDHPGSARWVEVVTPHFKASDQSPYAVARYTPVDVAPMLRWSLYNRDMTEDELDDMAWSQSAPSGSENTAPDGPKPRKPLTVVALSATLPAGFSRQAGLRTQPVEYPSPFDDAYGESVLFVPRASTPADVEALTSNRYGRSKFDTDLHRDWALAHMLDLVEANGGSALILAATAASGRHYAEALARASQGRWRVLSQWDGVALRRQVAAWKDDTSAVMVGTRSVFTGVDAPGDTCTLVIVDRPPRAASNPVDDARVEMLVADAQMDKWTADRLVYVSDAGELVEQGAGRLIRKVTDSGMVAVLDPRLLKSSPFAYPEPTRQAYLATLRRFEERIADKDAALAWLRARSGAREATS